MWTPRVDNVTADRSMTLGSDFPGPAARTWRPRPAVIVGGLIAVLATLGWVVWTSSPLDRLMGGIIAAVLAVVTVIAWRRRLVAGPRGLLIRGLRGDRIVPWSQVRGLERATSSRLGLASTTIEIDLVDDDLLVFGRTDLGDDPAEVLTALQLWWPVRQGRSG